MAAGRENAGGTTSSQCSAISQTPSPVFCFCRMLLLIALVCSAFVPGEALDRRKQISQYVQTVLTDKTGLPQDSVSAIAQTSDGYLWFGTQEGLARFDGLRISTFDSVQNRDLRDSLINVLAASRDGSLWVGTRSEVTHLQNGVFHTVISAQSPVNAIYESRDGRLWVGSEKGLYVVEHDVVHFLTANEGLPSVSIRCITETQDGRIWFGTEKGLYSLTGTKFHGYKAEDGIAADTILSLASMQDGSLWIGSVSGLVHWKNRPLESWPASQLPPRARVSSLLVDRGGNLWVGFEHSGIATLRDGKLVRYTAKDGLPNDDTMKIFEDQGGHLWVGFGEGGVVEMRDGVFSTVGKQEGLTENMVWTVLQSRDGSIWAGTDSTGLDHILKSGEVQSFSARDGLAEGVIYAMCEGRDGSIWVGSEHGTLGRVKNGKVTSFHDSAGGENRLQAIVEDPSGDLWLGFHEVDGLVRFHNGVFTHFPVPGLMNTILLAADGSLWLGADHGGISHFKDGVVKNYTTRDGLLSNFGVSIYEDKEGVIWAGTSPGGLNRIKDGRVTTYSIEQGLPSLTVGSIIEDDLGNLWMNCNKGIIRISKKELNDYADGKIAAVHSVMYGTADGMRSAECNYGSNPSVWKSTDGHLWFVTVAGLLSVDPEHSQTLNTDPTPWVEGVLYNRRSTPFHNGVNVGPGAGDLEIQFTAPDFVAPERVRFRYRLASFDQDWVESGTRREAFYTKVPPGHYRFEVQGADRDGQWGTHTAVLEVQVTPHVWQTVWFRVLCGLILLVAGVLLYRIRVHYLVARNHALEEKVGSRTKELQEALEVAAAARDALHEQATRDSLTRLWNRRTILEILTSETARARREGLSICVLMADVDHFKRVNDTYGHMAGDRVLEEVAGRIQGLIRPYDSAGRYGGEEFLIVLPGCNLTDGHKRAEEFRKAISSASLFVGDVSIDVTCSFGVAADVTSPSERLILDADRALYAAKLAGRNRVHVPAVEAAFDAWSASV